MPLTCIPVDSLMGAKIVRIALQPSEDDEGNTIYDPCIELITSTHEKLFLTFQVQETGIGVYGIKPIVHKEDRGRV